VPGLTRYAPVWNTLACLGLKKEIALAEGRQGQLRG
jgi:hypothetical protein